MRKFLISVSIIALFIVSALAGTMAETVVGDVQNNKVQEQVANTDQFTPYQNGNQSDLKDNKNIPKNVKDRIYDLSDVNSRSKTGTVTQKDVNPSTNRQK